MGDQGTSIEEIKEWVAQALVTTDPHYLLVEVVRTCIELERERCAKIAEEHIGSINRSSTEDIAKKIREGNP